MEAGPVQLLASDRVDLPQYLACVALPALCDLQLTFTDAIKDVQDLVVSTLSN